MSNSPSTFRAEPDDGSGIDWMERVALHRADDGGGVLGDFKAVRHGTLAELVRYMASLSDEDRPRYVIEKHGDHRIGPGEALALSRRADFPG